MATIAKYSYHDRVRAISATHFGILSPERILEMSAGEIYRHTLEGEGTLKDPIMGTTKKSELNPITGLTSRDDPGQFGHLILAKPVINFLFYGDVVKVMNSVCWRCGHLLADHFDHDFVTRIYNTPLRNRLTLISNMKKSGKSVKECPLCHAQQPKIRGSSESIRVMADWSRIEGGDPEALASDEDEGSGISSQEKEFNPERILKAFERIPDEDVRLMGFDPERNHPKWMILTILPIAPPAMRPSISSDTGSKGAAEDDLTMIYTSIIKTNNHLKEAVAASLTTTKTRTQGEITAIQRFWRALQNHIAAFVDNEAKCVDDMSQKGRKYKTIKQRLKDKEGRVRGNLMGKRVDFSGRSVVIASPNISVGQVGVPQAMCENLVYPEVVNRHNYSKLLKLVERGDRYPGARWVASITYENGIPRRKERSLAYVEWSKEKGERPELPPLAIGDIVYRHLLPGDLVIFNRQPSLHKMSMMVHEVVPMPGKSLGIPLTATPPYGADCDGDEMNIHLLLSQVTRAEGLLMRVQRMIISPQGSSQVIGLVQDAHTGMYRLSKRVNQTINMAQLMQLVALTHNYTGTLPEPIADHRRVGELPTWTLLDVINAMIPKGFTQSHREYKIQEGKFREGTLGKAAIGKGATGGLIHAIWKDLGPTKARHFLDDMARVVGYWFHTIEGYSTGPSDMIIDISEIQSKVLKELEKVNDLVASFNEGTYSGDVSHQVRNLGEQMELLMNKELGEISGRARKATVAHMEADPDNRIMDMILSGSKGKPTNIAQIAACIGQQAITGQRVKDYLVRRSLIHFPKDDHGAESRGFVIHSYIQGLSPTEYVFHGMAGREGVISTSIMTAETGYMQRQFIKATEDAKVDYTGAVINANKVVIQYCFGGDGFDGAYLERISVPYLHQSDSQFHSIYSNLTVNWSTVLEPSTHTRATATPGELTRVMEQEYQIMRQDRELLKKNPEVGSALQPIHWSRLLENIDHQFGLVHRGLASITPQELFNRVQEFLGSLKVHPLPQINQVAIRQFLLISRPYLSSAELIVRRHYTVEALEYLLREAHNIFHYSLISPGECVGPVAAQSMGERTTQLTLDTFHSTGQAEMRGTKGVPRAKEIMTVTRNPKMPSTEVRINEDYMYHGFDQPDIEIDESEDDWEKRLQAMKEQMLERAHRVKNLIKNLTLGELISRVQIVFDPDPRRTVIPEDQEMLDTYHAIESELQGEGAASASTTPTTPYVLRLEFDRKALLENQTTMFEIERALLEYQRKTDSSKFSYESIFSDENDAQLVGRLRFMGSELSPHLMLRQIQEEIQGIRLKGIPGIEKCSVREVKQTYVSHTGEIRVQKHPRFEHSIRHITYVIDTAGVNLPELAQFPEIDISQTMSNDFHEVYELLGVDAARNLIVEEFDRVMEGNVGRRHLNLLADLMTTTGVMLSVARTGVKKSDTRPWSRTSYEEILTQVKDASLYGETDNMEGVSSNIMFGQPIKGGTNAFEIVLDEEMLLQEAQPTKDDPVIVETEILEDEDLMEECAPDLMEIEFAP